jgi:hypothetical protein
MTFRIVGLVADIENSEPRRSMKITDWSSLEKIFVNTFSNVICSLADVGVLQPVVA